MVSQSTYRTGALTPKERAVVQAVVTAAHDADGIDPLNENAWFALRGQRPAIHWIAPSRGEVRARGYAQLDVETHSAIIVVDPAARRQGVGAELLALIRATGKNPSFWSFGNLPAARAFAERSGLNPVRQLLIMRRNLVERPVRASVEDAAPAGIVIRTFEPDDLNALVEVNADAFTGHPEQGDLTARDFEQRMAEPWFDPQGLFLALDDDTGRLLGYHWTKVEGGVGEVYAIAVAPDTAGRGIGRALLTTGLRHLQDLGLDSVILYVEAANERVVEMYRYAGFVEVSRDVSYE